MSDSENKTSLGLTPEQKVLLAELQALDNAVAATIKKCPACGSDGHAHCNPPKHHGGGGHADVRE
jgi:hypothetical protein